MKKILITGGNGNIGRYLSKLLINKGYSVFILTRGRTCLEGDVPSYHWDPLKNEIDQEAITDTEYIIHLAGENIAAKRWSEQRKKEIIDSRILSADFLLKQVQKRENQLKAFISASAIGYYGSETTNKIFNEDDFAGKDFLSDVCVRWENASNRFIQKGIRVVSLRTGVVLSENGGALKRMSMFVKLGLGSSPGTGAQYIPWIHIEDLCNIYVKAIEDESYSGSYNAVAPEHIKSAEFYKSMAKVLRKPLLMPRIPKFAMQLLFGDLSVILLEGSRVSCNKIVQKGFQFKYTLLEDALLNIYKRQS